MKVNSSVTFYREERFKETQIGKIPEDWEVVRLERVVRKIKAGGTPLTTNKEYWNGNIPFVKIEDITSLSKYLSKTITFISKKGLENSSTWIVPENSLLLAMYGSLGELAINKIPVATNQAILGIIPKCDIEFLYYWFLYFKPNWRRYAKPTTQANLTAEIVRNILIPLPSLPEQQKIAEILSTVDEAVQKTTEVVDKTERLKKGLMQELLTKGIGHKEFKDTEIGRIPKDWKVIRLENIALIIMGQSPPSSTYNREGIGLPFLQGKMEFGNIYPTPVTYCSEPIKIAESNDVLLSVRAPVGDVNIAPYKLCIGRGLAALRFKQNNSADHVFYFYYLLKIKSFLEMLGKGSTFKAIVKDDLENLKVPLPPLIEQQKIAEILSTVDKKLEIERKEKERLIRVKQGLMDLLLTGKIRVRVN